MFRAPGVFLVRLAACAGGTLLLCGALSCGGSSLQPRAPECDASLWNHVHDPTRLQMIDACRTVTGVVMDIFKSDDGDIDMPIALDAGFETLLNQSNTSKLHGWLQVEAICQAPIHPDVPDSFRACRNFTGSVLVPPVGTHVQVTGSYTLDHDHGWMEIHPATVVTRQ